MAGIADSPDNDPSTGSQAGAPDDLEEQVEKAPRLFVVAAAVIAVAASVLNFAYGHPNAGVLAASIGLLAIGGGLSWLSMERRRVRDAERILAADRTARR
jgi:hypothetical protein